MVTNIQIDGTKAETKRNEKKKKLFLGPVFGGCLDVTIGSANRISLSSWARPVQIAPAFSSAFLSPGHSSPALLGSTLHGRKLGRQAPESLPLRWGTSVRKTGTLGNKIGLRTWCLVLKNESSTDSSSLHHRRASSSH